MSDTPEFVIPPWWDEFEGVIEHVVVARLSLIAMKPRATNDLQRQAVIVAEDALRVVIADMKRDTPPKLPPESEVRHG